MNDLHLQFLASPDWAKMLETDLLPWILESGDLGDDVLEIGPGPGLSTDLLRSRAPRVTALELDDDLAAQLADRLAGTNVQVVHGDGTNSGLPSDRFTTATCFSMLHHMPEAQMQDQLFAEVHRVLRPGGQFVAVDSLDNDAIRAGHVDDTFVPVDPDTLGARLEAAGFEATEIDLGDYQFRFRTRKS
ncbi:MAG: class I SAM-dependent methyltransferase [Actinobacteria bacterium]|nr:MAG: class I SAM-dependent methyltransferase [Actinomycetota bacterium]